MRGPLADGHVEGRRAMSRPGPIYSASLTALAEAFDPWALLLCDVDAEESHNADEGLLRVGVRSL